MIPTVIKNFLILYCLRSMAVTPPVLGEKVMGATTIPATPFAHAAVEDEKALWRPVLRKAGFWCRLW